MKTYKEIADTINTYSGMDLDIAFAVMKQKRKSYEAGYAKALEDMKEEK